MNIYARRQIALQFQQMRKTGHTEAQARERVKNQFPREWADSGLAGATLQALANEAEKAATLTTPKGPAELVRIYSIALQAAALPSLIVTTENGKIRTSARLAAFVAVNAIDAARAAGKSAEEAWKAFQTEQAEFAALALKARPYGEIPNGPAEFQAIAKIAKAAKPENLKTIQLDGGKPNPHVAAIAVVHAVDREIDGGATPEQAWEKIKTENATVVAAATAVA